ncbi:putative deoxyribonuclease TATDN3 isoform X2 [Onychostruthus taczanowskii]|uniref:putative deoxyribonuclease TATDN3 isoform X2 n=1 Tax=Onychostruthus taczanowskii TaxID=356909 RepID=UPI001B8059C3|nr:putative deoxyribonuclease TATDN3 isoform X2 [Onychostruthus taczanowskii]
MAGPVDCHCHLAAPCFQPDVAAVVRAAEQAAVSALVVVSEQAREFRSVVELSERFPGFVVPCLGVHPVQEVSPEEQRSVTLKDLDAALPLIELYKDKLVGIGEVGLDFTPRFASTDEQKEGQRQVLIKQIELARRLDLPLNVHSRSAGRPTINLLKEQGATKVLLHAFDGKPSVAMEGVRAGYYFSIPPSIIRSEQQKLVKQLPLENMCLETDSPALGPEKQEGASGDKCPQDGNALVVPPQNQTGLMSLRPAQHSKDGFASASICFPWCLITASVQEAHDTECAEPLGGEGGQMMLCGHGGGETQDVPAILSTGRVWTVL